MRGDEISVESEAVTGAFNLDNHDMMEETVEQCGGDHSIIEDLAPFGETTIVGQDHGAFFVASVDQLEKEIGATSGDWQVADLADDQERGAAMEADTLGQAPLALGSASMHRQTLLPAFAAAPPSATARCDLPVPGGPRKGRSTLPFVFAR